MNKKFNEYKSINYYEVGSDILSFWKKKKIFEKSITLRNNGDVFSFYEGPPSANGMPGIHHVMSRTVKDIFCRYKTLKGFKVYRKGGWDAHGLPVEIQVEKKLGKSDGFKVRGEFTIYNYNHKLISEWAWDRADYHIIFKDNKVTEYGMGEVRQKDIGGVQTFFIYAY